MILGFVQKRADGVCFIRQCLSFVDFYRFKRRLERVLPCCTSSFQTTVYTRQSFRA